MRPSARPEDWNEEPADGIDLGTALGQCCHGSRLIGRDPSLVLHGGGNTSVKADWADVTGRTSDALFVKGSGWDLASMLPAGFAALGMGRLQELLSLDSLSDEHMARELAAAKFDPAAPQPSVESLLHAYLPFPAVQHSHADLIVAVTNTPDGEGNVRQIYGDDVVLIPYVMPGFDLAKLVTELWPDQYHRGVTGMVLANHGLFTFGENTREAYERHLDLISQARQWVDLRVGEPEPREPETAASVTPVRALAPPEPARLAGIRRRVSHQAGRPIILTSHRDGPVARFVARDDLIDLAGRGPLTPDHVIRTKRVALVGDDVGAYASAYREYFETNAAQSAQQLTMLDPAPRVVVDPELGMLCVGVTAKDAAIAADIYHHTIDIASTCEDHLGGYAALSPAEIFQVEYWDLEQAKLRGGGAAPPLAGQVALVTGAASGIGRACAEHLLSAGAAVVGLDRADEITETFDHTETFDDTAWVGVPCDVTDAEAQRRSIALAVDRFGGIDIVVASAGIFPPSGPIESIDRATWRATMAVNVAAVADLLAAVEPLLSLSPVAPQVIIVGSKNTQAPGKGAAAYSASKAAVTQLARVAALEWADRGIRVNVIHPDAVFDTGLWTDDVLEARAKHYGLTVDEYRRRNLLGTEVTSNTVAEMVLAMCGPGFAATTGAQIPIDGGNERVI